LLADLLHRCGLTASGQSDSGTTIPRSIAIRASVI
jgi:hypothetical protein